MGRKNVIDLGHYKQNRVRESGEESWSEKAEKTGYAVKSPSRKDTCRWEEGVTGARKSKRDWDFEDGRNKAYRSKEVPADRVAELKAAISEGRYFVDARDIAEKIIQHHLIDLII